MRRVRRFVVAAGLVAAFAMAGAVPAGADHAQRADIPIRAVGAILTGAEEVPGPGDPAGFGAAGLLINTRTDRICFAIFVKHIAPATAAHIHVGAPGIAGPVVVPLNPPPTNGFSAACVMAGPVADEIASNPGGFYVNVHNADFPAGAVRGQLH